ncbi:D-sedoheptulose-7-phosphate isomerase [Caldiplasma sukawensis]
MNDEEISSYLEEGSKVRLNMDIKTISYIDESIYKTFKNGKKLIIFGNGGSAADAQHIAAEFVGRFEMERKPLPAMILHGNSSSVTAIGNDYSYDEVFSRQILAFADVGDMIIALSTSGNSTNVVRGVEAAIKKGCNVFAITGKDGGKLSTLINNKNILKIESKRTSIIQECTIAAGHIFSKIVEDKIKENGEIQ